MVRYKVYQKVKAIEKRTEKVSEGDTSEIIVTEEDMQDLLKEIDLDSVRKDVFNLYDIRYGLDT